MDSLIRDIIIEAAGPDDLAPLHALIEGAYRGDGARRGWTHEADLIDGQRTDTETLAAIIDDARQHILVVRNDDAIIGCVALTDKGDGTCYLGMLTVAPDLQAAGLGRQLIEAGERHVAASFGARRIEMTVIAQRAELIAWYERRGYHRTGERRPFPYGDPRIGTPRSDALDFIVLERDLG
ncbi:MAG: family acetyltransferase [Sphingomonas bacterium]|uniref:GNAT family N-acetyltransferase n=1 Tax=Sphingomonas bacterium TaxID=1895847 RepID=UPI002614B15A|nr:GNAT family N-acetyltransferase [Sphingomonas bacterium]MDB5708019.1 family acetyltransferase [Sphingomonas bacterium]